MTIPAAHCEAKLHAFRRTQDGVVVSFVIHPAEVPQALALDPLGSRYMLALAGIGDDEQPAPLPEKPAEPNPRGEAGRQRYVDASVGEKAVTRAALLPKDVRFRKWAALTYDGIAVLDGSMAEDFIRETCGVLSRKEIAGQPSALARFLQMETKYLADTGQMAEMRR